MLSQGLSRYGAAWVLVFAKATVGSFQALAERHGAWFAEHPGWDAIPMLHDEMDSFIKNTLEEGPNANDTVE